MTIEGNPYDLNRSNIREIKPNSDAPKEGDMTTRSPSSAASSRLASALSKLTAAEEEEPPLPYFVTQKWKHKS